MQLKNLLIHDKAYISQLHLQQLIIALFLHCCTAQVHQHILIYVVLNNACPRDILWYTLTYQIKQCLNIYFQTQTTNINLGLIATY
jgi:hypothetical protein